MKTVEEFAATLSDEVKADPKQIEEEFKTYCLTAKPKQQRLVNRQLSISYLYFTNDARFHLSTHSVTIWAERKHRLPEH